MARKTDQQIAEERLGELRKQLGAQQDRLEELEREYNRNISRLDGAELEQKEQELVAQRYLVRQTQESIDEIKSLREEYQADQQAAAEYKWRQLQPLIQQAIVDNHVSYNVLNNRYIFCKNMGTDNSGTVNPTFQTFDGSRATSAFSKMIGGKKMLDENTNINRLFMEKGHTHYQEVASFLTAKWSPANVYNKASVIREYWLQPEFEQPYDPDLDMLIYCVAGGKQENIEHLEKWIAYKWFYPERSANTPNLDLGGSPGGNGKTILIEMLKTIFTPNCVVPAVAKELKDGFNASWELAVILHFDEPEEKELPASKMKNATGGVEQRVERKGVDAYSSDRNYSIVATSNNPLGVFKLAGSGAAGEDRRYSVINTDRPLREEAQHRYQCDETAAQAIVSRLASEKIRDRADVARWLGTQILRHGVAAMTTLPALHGEDYRRRFEDQKNTADMVFDQLLPVFAASGVITVRILQDILTVVYDGKKPAPKTVKRQFKDYLTRNRVAFTEKTRDRVDIVMQGQVLSTQQGHVFRLDPYARQFYWDQVSTARPSDTQLDDLLIQV